MAKFSKMPASQAPAPSKQTGRLAARMREYENYVKSVGADEVGQLVPEEGESPRGLVLRLARAAKRLNLNVETWIDDGKVYFRVR